VLDRLEQALERVVEGSVAGFFRLRVQPADIGRQLERAMLGRPMTSVGAILVPNQYEVRLHPDDANSFAGWEDALCREMEAWLADLAYERGLATVGPIRVAIVGDDSVARRSVRASSSFVEVVPRSRQQREGRFSTLKLVPVDGSGTAIVLGDRAVTVGRSESNDLALVDGEVSRRHARLEVDGNGRGWIVIDLNSTNGTWVNGTRVERAAIAHGDIVTFAHVSFHVQSDDRQHH
jgi:hypothetical protein